MSSREGIERYIAFLNSANEANIAELANYCAPDVIFKDPFNYVQGSDRFVKIMQESFETLHNVRFEVLEAFWSEDGAVIKWHFHFAMKSTKPDEIITGFSEVRANEDGMITSHIDQWDSGERIYARIPLLGWFIRLVRQKVSAGLDNL